MRVVEDGQGAGRVVVRRAEEDRGKGLECNVGMGMEEMGRNAGGRRRAVDVGRRGVTEREWISFAWNRRVTGCKKRPVGRMHVDKCREESCIVHCTAGYFCC